MFSDHQLKVILDLCDIGLKSGGLGVMENIRGVAIAASQELENRSKPKPEPVTDPLTEAKPE